MALKQNGKEMLHLLHGMRKGLNDCERGCTGLFV